MKIKAAVLHEQGKHPPYADSRPLVIETLELAPPRPGSYMGSCSPGRDIPRFISLYLQGKLPVDRLRSGSLGFDGINAGFDRLAEGSAVRQILEPHA